MRRNISAPWLCSILLMLHLLPLKLTFTLVCLIPSLLPWLFPLRLVSMFPFLLRCLPPLNDQRQPCSIFVCNAVSAARFVIRPERAVNASSSVLRPAPRRVDVRSDYDEAVLVLREQGKAATCLVPLCLADLENGDKMLSWCRQIFSVELWLSRALRISIPVGYGRIEILLQRPTRFVSI